MFGDDELKTITVNGTDYVVGSTVEGIGAGNCGLRQLNSLTIQRKDKKNIKKQEVYDVVATKEWEEAVVGTRPTSTAFVINAGLTYPHDEEDAKHSWADKSQARTRDVMAGIVRSKRGAYVCTPLYDNKAHPEPDSLQYCMVWWPEVNVGHIIDDRPMWRLPASKIRVGMEKKWAKRGKVNKFTGKPEYPNPRTLHRAVALVRKNFGSKRPNPIKEVKVEGEDKELQEFLIRQKKQEAQISGWPDVS